VSNFKDISKARSEGTKKSRGAGKEKEGKAGKNPEKWVKLTRRRKNLTCTEREDGGEQGTAREGKKSDRLSTKTRSRSRGRRERHDVNTKKKGGTGAPHRVSSSKNITTGGVKKEREKRLTFNALERTRETSSKEESQERKATKMSSTLLRNILSLLKKTLGGLSQNGSRGWNSAEPGKRGGLRSESGNVEKASARRKKSSSGEKWKGGSVGGPAREGNESKIYHKRGKKEARGTKKGIQKKGGTKSR